MVSSHLQDKPQLFSMACKALWGLALLACSASSHPALHRHCSWATVNYSPFPVHQAAVHLRTFARAVCSAWNVLPMPTRPVHSTNASLLSTAFVLSFSQAELELCFVIPQYSMNTCIITFTVLDDNCWKLVCRPLEWELLESRTVSSSSLYPQSFAQCIAHRRFSINDY